MTDYCSPGNLRRLRDLARAQTGHTVAVQEAARLLWWELGAAGLDAFYDAHPDWPAEPIITHEPTEVAYVAGLVAWHAHQMRTHAALVEWSEGNGVLPELERSHE